MNWISVEDRLPEIRKEVYLNRKNSKGIHTTRKVKRITVLLFCSVWDTLNNEVISIGRRDHWCEITEPSE